MLKRIVIASAFLFLFAAAGFGADEFKVKPPSLSPTTASYVPGEIIVKFKKNVDTPQAQSASTKLGATVISTNDRIGFNLMSIPAAKSVDEMVAAFKNLPEVEYAEPNYIAHAFLAPNDPYYVYQWHMPLINTGTAWDQSTGSGVVVAVIDAGVAYENFGAFAQAPDLAGTSFVPGWDFVNNDSHPNDDNAHGTHVAGTIAQTTNNGLGVTGVAFGCSIMPVKVLDAAGNGSFTNVANGIIWAADHGAKVINMSLGASVGSTALQNAIAYADGLGVTIVCAAGNAGTSAPQYPAAYTQCISVSAVRFDQTLAYYSSFGSTIDVCAPGGDVTVNQNGDPYVDGVLQQTHDGVNFSTFAYYFYQGTSMASPHVAGLAALLISKAGTLTPTQVRAAIQNTAKNLGPAGWDQQFGYGLIDANAALLSITPPTNPPVANFSGTPTSGDASLTVNFTDASTNAPTSWNWTFGDGGTSTAQNPSHVYTTAGTYDVSLTATNAAGSNANTKIGYITVTTPPCNPPVANFTGSPASGNFPLNVNFTDQSTNSPTSWSWDFGDAGTSTAQNPSHTYTAAGTFTVSLTSTNSCGSNGNTKTAYITVTTPPAQQCDDFADGNITNWLNSSGTWTVTGGAMKGNSNTSNARRTSPFGSFSTATIDVSVRMNTGQSQRKARVIWSYVNSSNYRFLEADDVNNRWRIYERVGGTNTQRLNVNSSISSTTWYAVKVTVSAGGSASFSVNGTTLGTYNFATSVTGLVGCGFNASNSDFDNFCVGAAVGGAAINDGDVLANSASGLLPDEFEVYQNYPNPFNPSTEISFSLPQAAHVSVDIFNILGQRIRTLLDGQANAGLTTLTWNSEDESGVSVSSGIYFYRVLVENRDPITKKMILVK